MQDKPDVIKRLETQLNTKLKPMALEEILLSVDNAYTLDENRRIEGLNLWNAELADISFLEDAAFAHLVHLELGSNKIADISSLSGLVGLTSLDLSSNQVSDISSLSGLLGLKELWLYDNKISDISSL